jgi:hypothetical protein
MKTCECCGADITPENPESDQCGQCERMRCCRCNMGRGTVCPECEETE